VTTIYVITHREVTLCERKPETLNLRLHVYFTDKFDYYRNLLRIDLYWHCRSKS